jgi:peptidoglycan-associated lipoprotein
MRVLLIALMLPLVAACSTKAPARSPSADIAQPSDADIAGRWRGHWTGTGLFHSVRDDELTLDLVQRGNVGHGRIVLDGTGAAESVPEDIRRAGLWGTRVFAEISGDRVTLRHQVDRRLFTADLKLSENGDRMFGLVRGHRPQVGLVLTREPARQKAPEKAPEKAPDAPPAPTQAAMAPPPPPLPKPEKVEPAPVVAAVPEPQPEVKAEETATTARPRQEEFAAVQELVAIHFDFDKADLRPDAMDQLQAHAEWLKAHAEAALLIEGHCDERGTAEYNVALGDRRAKSVRDHLAAHGVEPDRVTTISYGKERPACGDDTTQCHDMNRRAEFRVKTR